MTKNKNPKIDDKYKALLSQYGALKKIKDVWAVSKSPEAKDLAQRLTGLDLADKDSEYVSRTLQRLVDRVGFDAISNFEGNPYSSARKQFVPGLSNDEKVDAYLSIAAMAELPKEADKGIKSAANVAKFVDEVSNLQGVDSPEARDKAVRLVNDNLGTDVKALAKIAQRYYENYANSTRDAINLYHARGDKGMVNGTLQEIAGIQRRNAGKILEGVKGYDSYLDGLASEMYPVEGSAILYEQNKLSEMRKAKEAEKAKLKKAA